MISRLKFLRRMILSRVASPEAVALTIAALVSPFASALFSPFAHAAAPVALESNRGMVVSAQHLASDVGAAVDRKSVV